MQPQMMLCCSLSFYFGDESQILLIALLCYFAMEMYHTMSEAPDDTST